MVWEASQQMLGKRCEKYLVTVSYYFWDSRSRHRKLSKCLSMSVRRMPFVESPTLFLRRIHRRNFSRVLEAEQLRFKGQWHVFIPWKILSPSLLCLLATRNLNFSEWVGPYGTHFLFLSFSSSFILFEFSLQFESHFFLYPYHLFW